MGFAEKLKQVRQERGLTQAELAEASGVPLGTLRDLEQGKRTPLLSNARKLAMVLKVSLDELAEPEPPATPKKGKGKK